MIPPQTNETAEARPHPEDDIPFVRRHTLTLCMLLLGVLTAALKFRECFEAGVFHSWDLFGHVAIVERLRASLMHGRIAFYDPYWFGGWPAFTFYAPLAHVLAALLAIPLAWLSSEPEQQSVQLLIGFSLILLPLSLFRTASRLLQASSPTRESTALALPWVAGGSGLFSLWFLRHPAEQYGVGVSAGTDLGLFPQVLSWHLLLAYAASVADMASRTEERAARAGLAFLICALILTHSLTFVCALAFGVSFLLWCRAGAGAWKSHLLGMGMAGMWLVPAVALGGQFTPVDRLPSAGSFWSLLAPQELRQMLWSLKRGNVLDVSSVPLVFAVALLATLRMGISKSGTAKRSLMLPAFSAIAFSTGTVASSDYFGLSFPMSIHLYRTPVNFLLLLLVGFAVALGRCVCSSRYRMPFLIFTLFACYQELRLFPERNNALPRNELFSAEQRLLTSLKRDSPMTSSERVIFEHLGRPGGKEVLSPHYLSSRLAAETGRETVGGLFIQSSYAQAFSSFPLLRLHVHSYSVGPSLALTHDSDRDALLERLTDLGARELVLDSRPDDPTRPEGGRTEGRYRVVDLSSTPAKVVEVSTKLLIGYRDSAGTLPFKEFETSFYGDDASFRAFSLIEIPPGVEVPSGVMTLLENGGNPANTSSPANGTRSFSVPRNVAQPVGWTAEDDALRERETRILHELHRLTSTRAGEPQLTTSDPLSTPEARFDFEGQEIKVSGLQPGRLVRLNYTYFPFWSTEDGLLYRGAADQMWLLPRRTEAVLRYQPRRSRFFWVGSLLSAVSLGALLLLRRR